MHVAVEPSFQKTKPVAPIAASWNFAEWFVISQTIFPALLYLPGSQHFRIVIRLAAYGTAIIALLYVHHVMNPRRRITPHPSSVWLITALGWLGLMILHPYTNSFLAGTASVGMYFAIMAPVFWVWAFVQTPSRLYRILWLFLLCNGVNCFFGVMQARDPAGWLPRDFSSVFTDDEQIQALIYEGAGGHYIIRPPGLGDSPGAVSGPGFFALYLGLVLAIQFQAWWRRVIAFIVSGLGGAAIFYSLVRSALLIGVGMIVAYLVLMLLRGKIGRAAAIVVIAFTIVAASFIYSTRLGGTSIVDRFTTLFQEDPASLYYENRGIMIEGSFNEWLVKYPLGQGLGRYGMINNYFGNQSKLDSRPIWVEIQWPGWLVDGGVILLFLYSMAILVAFYQQFTLQFSHPNPQVRDLASIIFALNAGLFALTFSYGVFLSPLGVEFWFLSGALHAVAYNTDPKHNRLKANPVVVAAAESPKPELPIYEPKMVSPARQRRMPPG